MEIKIDDLSDPRIEEFLNEHIEDMKSVSPPESKHALDLEGLKEPSVTFWSAWEKGVLIGCSALKGLDGTHAEIKSMRVSTKHRGRGYASKLLKHILNEATLMGYGRLSLETGSMPFFNPARKLYESFGFRYCAPFSDYKEDPHSVFMSLDLANNV
ncbi:GNAT family N-acetyltransferase [Exilibacterium tricleocarpae]|uniref:GNAT family N-acetyltransferase n=1 Tax=Exilibacterium tricleocarpae TaxID=2591008 RepID=A0A545ST71_9GAMM|nr:GNAT family N-acetyltransferase [Exilibacterium tricleocarpae]TQV68167.1 GNAT family N-acetyltransferase [Exilibacterium tricleocarpae]